MCLIVQERLKLVDEIITRDEAGRMPLEVMMKDQFANYVVQKVRLFLSAWPLGKPVDSLAVLPFTCPPC
jgi:hypothetical protein